MARGEEAVRTEKSHIGFEPHEVVSDNSKERSLLARKLRRSMGLPHKSDKRRNAQAVAAAGGSLKLAMTASGDVAKKEEGCDASCYSLRITQTS